MAGLAVCVLLVTACVSPPREPRDPTPGMAHFSVVTFNVNLDRYNDAATVDAVGQADADVVFLQEISDPWPPVLEAAYADRYPYRLYAPDPGSSGLAVLSRFPVEDQGIRPGPGGWHPAWHLLVHAPGGPVQVLHVHLRALFNGNGGPVTSYFRAGDDHVREIEIFSSECLSARPTLVLGDFNEAPDGPAVGRLVDRGFENALPLFHPGQETWRHASPGGQLAETIDHVLFDARFAPLNAFVVRAGHSDHLPVVAELEYAPLESAASVSSK